MVLRAEQSFNWVTTSTYTVRSQGYGLNPEPLASVKSNPFLYDPGPPTTSITFPAQNGQYNNNTMSVINGAAQAAVPLDNIASVGVAIQKGGSGGTVWLRNIGTNPQWVNSGSALPGAAGTVNWNTASGAGNWQLSLGTNPWTSDNNYVVYAIAQDQAGNYALSSAQSSFLFDLSSPTAQITSLTGGTTYSSLATITGTAWDTATVGASSGTLSNVAIEILENNSGHYWQNGIFGPGAAWSTATVCVPNVSASSWTYTFNGSNLTQGYSYTVLVRSSDTAGNFQQSFGVNTASITFVWDAQPPVAAIIYPFNGQMLNISGIMTMSGTATDTPAGVNTVMLQLQRIQSGVTYYYTGSGNWNTTMPPDLTASYPNPGAPYWQYSIQNMPSDEWYNLKVRGIDAATPPNNGTFGAGYNFIVDTTPPVAYVTYPQNGGYYKIESLTSVMGTANGDLSGLSSVQTQISKTGTGIIRSYGSSVKSGVNGNITWSTSTADIPWSSGSQYSVQVMSYDLAGDTQTVISSVTFTVDEAAPSISIYSSDPATWAAYTVSSGTISDSISYVSTVTVAIQRSDGKWFTGIDFSGNSAFYSTATVNGGLWSYTGFAPYLQQNNGYTFFAQATNAAGIQTTVFSSIDASSPTIVVQTPLASDYRSVQLPLISGTAADRTSGVQSVWISLYKPLAGYWNGNSASPGWGAPNWVLASGTTGWYVTSPVFASNVTYTLQVAAHDFNNNYTTTTAVNFIVDNTTPTASVTLPTPGTFMNTALVSVTGTASRRLWRLRYSEPRGQSKDKQGAGGNGPVVERNSVGSWRPRRTLAYSCHLW